MALDGEVGTIPWEIKGELILNCNCTVFCPCVVSLGTHPPTEGHCQAWSGVRIDDIDERATDDQYEALVAIFSGAARGTTGLFGLLVGEFLGAERAPITFETVGKERRLMVGKKIKGSVIPVEGKDGKDIVVTNTEYWMGPDITVAKATQGRVRAFGRVWDFDGRSAEICQIDWKGPR
jgi:hypothetical protein